MIQIRLLLVSCDHVLWSVACAAIFSDLTKMMIAAVASVVSKFSFTVSIKTPRSPVHCFVRSERFGRSYGKQALDIKVNYGWGHTWASLTIVKFTIVNIIFSVTIYFHFTKVKVHLVCCETNGGRTSVRFIMVERPGKAWFIMSLNFVQFSDSLSVFFCMNPCDGRKITPSQVTFFFLSSVAHTTRIRSHLYYQFIRSEGVFS